MSAHEPGPIERQRLATYLAQVASHLPGSAAVRRDILDELEYGLCESMRAHRRQGLGPAAAALAATAEFGPAGLVGVAYAREVRLRQVDFGSRATLGLLAVATVVWQVYRHAIGDLSFAVPTAGWQRQAFHALTVTMPILPGVAQLAAAALTITSACVTSAHERGQIIVRWLTVALSAAMGLMLVNMLAIVALMPATPPVLHRWLVPFTLLAISASAFALSLLVAYRARTAHKLRDG